MIVAGFGFTSRATADSLAAALAATGYDGPLDAIACPADKCAAPALTALAAARALPLRAIPDAALRAVHTETKSPRSLSVRGTGSVAEAAALAAAGLNAALLVSRTIAPDRMATCAIASGEPT